MVKRIGLFMVAALLAVGVAGSASADVQVIDFTAMMTQMAEKYIALTGDYPYMDFHPTGIEDLYAFCVADGHPDEYDEGDSQEACDNNENGVPDAEEFKLLEAIFADDGAPGHETLHESFKDNVFQLSGTGEGTDFGDLGSLAASLAPNLKYIQAAYALLGDGSYNRYTYDPPGSDPPMDYIWGATGSWGVVGTVIAGMDTYGSLWSEADAPSVTAYARYPDDVSMCGDADGDGVVNINEYYAAADVAAYVAAALDDGVTDTEVDPNNACAGVGAGYEFGTNLFYNPANQHVYANVAETVWPAARDIISQFQIGGTELEGSLVRIDDAAENAWVAANIATVLDGSIWLGGSDEVQEGKWVWDDNGDQFWQGTASGSAQNGLYTNWGAPVGSGEPNNASPGEDYLEMGTAGNWNDNKVYAEKLAIAEFTNAGAGYPDVSPADGIPDFWAGLLNLTTVDILNAPVAPMLTGSSVIVTATSDSEEDTSFAWESSDEAVATVVALTDTTAQLTAVSAGEAWITATANTSAAIRSKKIRVRDPLWYEACNLANNFHQQGVEILGAALELPYDTMDLDGDGVPDAWALQLLAYAACTGGVEGKTVDPATVAAQFLANAEEMEGIIGTAADLLTFLAAQGPNLATLMTAFGTAGAMVNPACDIDYTNSAQAIADLTPILGAPTATYVVTTYGPLVVALRAGIESVAGPLPNGNLSTLCYALNLVAAGVVDEYGTLITGLGLATDVLAGLTGLSTEMGMVVGSLLPISDINDLVAAYQGFAQVLNDLYVGFTLDALCLSSGDQALLAGYIAAAAALEEIADPVFAIYGVDGKAEGEPFAGAGRYYDDNPLTNAQVAAAVLAAGGGPDDFVQGASGDFGDFWLGNPELPVAGMFGLTLLSAALVLAYTRRSKK